MRTVVACCVCQSRACSLQYSDLWKRGKMALSTLFTLFIFIQLFILFLFLVSFLFFFSSLYSASSLLPWNDISESRFTAGRSVRRKAPPCPFADYVSPWLCPHSNTHYLLRAIRRLARLLSIKQNCVPACFWEFRSNKKELNKMLHSTRDHNLDARQERLHSQNKGKNSLVAATPAAA